MAQIQLSSTVQVSGTTGGLALPEPETTEAPLVLLVHGAGMDRTVWSLQTRWLAHHGCPALAIDLPGHGSSIEEPRDSIAGYAEWLATIVAEVARPVHVVGHSMGTFIALEAGRLVDLAGMTLIGTAAAMPVHPGLLQAAQDNDPLAAQLMSGWAFAPATRTGPHPSPGSSMVGSTQAMIGQSRPGVLHADLTMCASYQTALDTAAATTAPVTLLLGELDRMTPVRAAQPLVEALPSATVHVVPGVGHMVPIEAPAITRSRIADAARHEAALADR